MSEFSDTEIWLAVAFAFGAGYFLVSFLARLMKTEPPPPVVKVDPVSSRAERVQVTLEDEKKCALVLGIDSGATEAEIDQAYHQSLAKYHPDKVTDLGEEFRRLATEKIREIEEAYLFLKQRGRIK